jgi:hypothetical protein
VCSSSAVHQHVRRPNLLKIGSFLTLKRRRLRHRARHVSYSRHRDDLPGGARDLLRGWHGVVSCGHTLCHSLVGAMAQVFNRATLSIVSIGEWANAGQAGRAAHLLHPPGGDKDAGAYVSAGIETGPFL